MRIEKLFAIFASLKLAVAVMTLSIVLVFWGTLAQVELGLYRAQEEFFRSFLVYWSPPGSGWRIPVFPGGYTLGFILLINLAAARIKTFDWSARKFGLHLVHGGVVLLLLGQLATDLLSVESAMHIREGASKNYSEMPRFAEMVVVESLPGGKDRVTAIPQNRLAGGTEFRPPELPFTVRVLRHLPNSVVGRRDANPALLPAATQGFGPQVVVHGAPLETAMDRRDMPSAVVEIVGPSGSLGTWLASHWIARPQPFNVEGREFSIGMRPRRLYKEYTIHLEDFRHEVYPGTRIPMDFSSMVRVENHRTGEERLVRIFMNRPLRYGGFTHYQASYDPDDEGTVLQVVRNPAWLTPYFGCLLVAFGLVWQFLVRLRPHLKRKTASS